MSLNVIVLRQTLDAIKFRDLVFLLFETGFRHLGRYNSQKIQFKS